jgi:hypothetical protein
MIPMFFFSITDYGLVIQIGGFLLESYNTINCPFTTTWGASAITINGTMVCVGGEYLGLRVYRSEPDSDIPESCDWAHWIELLEEDEWTD